VSVAFRRESDEEHKEPRFELPIPPGPNLVTERGLGLIKARVAELENAPEDGDEAALADAKRTLRYWRTRLATAEIAPAPPADEIAFGSQVLVAIDGTQKRLAIVGGDEADPAAGLIAFISPMARALIGLAEGETTEWSGRTIEVLAIEG
jgi:transcription elongation GreA/GreB family factor